MTITTNILPTFTTQKLSLSDLTDNKLNKLIDNSIMSLPKIGEIVKGKVISASKQEIVVDLEGFTTGTVRGPEVKFLPREYTNLKEGDEVEALVLDIDNENGQTELSLKAATVGTAWAFINDTLKKQELVKVKITGANKGGLLCYLKGITGFLPVSHLAPEHYPKVDGGDKKKILKKLRDFIGSEIGVKVISVEQDREKVILSEKKACEDEQRTKLKNYQIGDVVQARVKNITNFGIFVLFDDNLDGLIHISEVPKFFQTAGGSEETTTSFMETIKEGEEIQAKIIDIKGPRAFLSLRDVEAVKNE